MRRDSRDSEGEDRTRNEEEYEYENEDILTFSRNNHLLLLLPEYMHIYTSECSSWPPFDLLDSDADAYDWLMVFVGVENISLIYRLVRREERCCDRCTGRRLNHERDMELLLPVELL